MIISQSPPERSLLHRAWPLSVFLAAMWVVRLADTFRTDGSSVAGVGIIPRVPATLTGILTAPLIHASWAHLFANTIPLLVLGALLLLGGTTEFLFVTLFSALASGAGTWLFGAAARHIGASGVVFGYVGYLLARPLYDRKLWSVVVTIVVAVTYGAALVWSLVPQNGISWSGHFFGFAGGIVATRLRGARRPRSLPPVNDPSSLLR
jgi:membrane associated rhomboid family serine protease